MIRRLSTLVLGFAGVLAAGCCSTPRREVAYVPPPCNSCGTGAPRVVPGPPPIAVPAVPAGPPAAAVPPLAVPQGAVYLPQTPQAVAAAPPVAAPNAVVQGSYNAPSATDSTYRPQEPTVRLAPPALSTPGPAQTQTKEPPPAAAEPPPVSLAPKEPTSESPIDIPQFAVVRTNVATGLQPFPDGVAWLKNHGYRTVLHVRAPGSDDTAARRHFEKNGLRYLTLDADPATLAKETVDTFNRIVADESNLPLFVYDKDASVTGGLWYLHFRLIEGWPDDKARTEAARLGFRQEQDDSHRTMWIAVQKLLEANGR